MAYKGGLIGNDNLYVPDAPTIGTATAGDQQISIAFTTPSDVGNDDVTGFVATAFTGSTAIGATGTSSPIVITGLTGSTAYTVSVAAINDYGTGPYSSASNSATPYAAAPSGYAWFIGGGISDAADYKSIDILNIASTGNATDFGDAVDGTAYYQVGAGSASRGLIFGGNGDKDLIQYFEFNTTGSAATFGSLSEEINNGMATGSSTRAVRGGGLKHGGAGNSNVMEYVTIANTGDTTDFGDLTVARYGNSGQANSTTRGMFMNGIPSSSNSDVVDYITIASTGNATDFGNTISAYRSACSTSSATRAVIAGKNFGNIPNGATNTKDIDYFTIASTGNATDFGELITNYSDQGAGASNKTRGVFAGGFGGSWTNVIEYITIASTGNATDFGDLTVIRSRLASASNSHGGIA